MRLSQRTTTQFVGSVRHEFPTGTLVPREPSVQDSDPGHNAAAVMEPEFGVLMISDRHEALIFGAVSYGNGGTALLRRIALVAAAVHFAQPSVAPRTARRFCSTAHRAARSDLHRHSVCTRTQRR